MTVNPSPVAPTSRKSALPRPLLVLVLIALIATAIYLWSLPLLQERQLSRATLTDLEARAKRGDDPRTLYYLGLRQKEKGDARAAFDTFNRAAKLTVSDTQLWLALADCARIVEGDQTAFNILGMFVKNNPNNPTGHLAMARLYLEHRSWRRAREEAAIAAASDAKLAEAWRIVGLSELSLNLPKDAETSLRRAVALAPADWQNQMALGDGLTIQNRFQDSIPVYQEAVRLAPDQAVPALSLGRAILKAAPANPTPQQLQTAEQNIRRSIELRSDIPVAYLLLGQCLAAQNRLPEARTALEQARTLAPNDPDAYFELSRVAARMGDTAASARYLAQHTDVLKRRNTLGDRQRTLRARIDNALGAGQAATADGLRRELAQVLANAGETNAALQEYSILLTRYPNDTALQTEAAGVRRQMQEAALAQQPLPNLLAQGESFLGQKQFPDAATVFAMAVKRDPKSAGAAEGLGLALQAMGRAEEATPYLLAATRLDPKRPRAEYALAVRYKEIGFLTQAVERYRKVIQLAPDNAEAWHALGEVLRDRDGSEADAEDALQHAADRAPDNAAFLLDLADIQDTNNKKMQAETTYRRALALAPRSAEAAASFAAFLVNNPTTAPRLEEAADLLNRALALDPNDDFARYYQGKLALQKGNAAEAVTLLEKVLKNPENAKSREIWYTLGRAYIRNGDRAKGEKAVAIAHKMETEDIAYAQAREQLSLHPNDPARHLDLARAFINRGDNARAIREFERTLVLDPKNAVARRELSALKTRLQAQGAMPSMSEYDALVSAADRNVRRGAGLTPPARPSP